MMGCSPPYKCFNHCSLIVYCVAVHKFSKIVPHCLVQIITSLKLCSGHTELRSFAVSAFVLSEVECPCPH